ncbi:hypothetical protein D5F01_LYC24223 [Larimichthys crocea]|uniref:Uncharacterized protein n=1 Tax=Larimichthys crocea TaxID=215358 RepID=A0A6G0HF85_LARCR|nr:hypothetical protein D5F01_LYC24223 [Larimichthys crocea]
MFPPIFAFCRPSALPRSSQRTTGPRDPTRALLHFPSVLACQQHHTRSSKFSATNHRRPSALPRSSQRTTGPRDPTRRRSSTFLASFASSFYSSTPMFPSHLRLSRRPSALPRSSQRATGPRDPTRRRSSTFHSSFASSFYFYFYVSLPSSPFSPSLRTPSFSQRTTGPRDPTRRRSSTFHSSFASSFYFSARRPPW